MCTESGNDDVETQQPRKQHLISRVLLRRFAGSGSSGQLRSFDLLYGQPHLRHPSAVGWRQNFVEHEPAEVEELWQQTERLLPAALDAVEAGTVLDLPDASEILRRTIALHFMRRDLVKDSFGKSFARARDGITVPPHFPGRHDVFRSILRSRLDAARAATFSQNLRSLFGKAQLLAARSHLEVVRSEAPLLIGDTAVLSLRRDGGVGFIPFSDAGTHVLPVGRHHMIALAKEDRVIDLPEEWAHGLNEQQIVNARRHVFFSPDDDLDTFVREIRDRHRGAASRLSQ
jgi:hypothetical protein